MNYLAHQFLSGDDEEIRFGNFIADFVKGNKYKEYSVGIQNGILYHREIDWYTDNHEIIRDAATNLRNDFSKYAGVALDVYLDHFLGKNWSEYAKVDLLKYTNETYEVIQSRKTVCPKSALHMLKYMKRDNWLYHYSFPEGVGRALTGISRRTHFESGLEKGKEVLLRDYEYLEGVFKLFLKDLLEVKSELLSNAILKREENL